MAFRQIPSGKVFSSLLRDRNTPSEGLEKKHKKLREGQRSGLQKMGINKQLVKKIITGGE